MHQLLMTKVDGMGIGMPPVYQLHALITICFSDYVLITLKLNGWYCFYNRHYFGQNLVRFVVTMQPMEELAVNPYPNFKISHRSLACSMKLKIFHRGKINACNLTTLQMYKQKC
ncbi:hypothetical protein SQ56_26445 [Klebsiella variicola]|nr:hypothetical protein SQ56_26445 [Klebsiella variicola]